MCGSTDGGRENRNAVYERECSIILSVRVRCLGC